MNLEKVGAGTGSSRPQMGKASGSTTLSKPQICTILLSKSLWSLSGSGFPRCSKMAAIAPAITSSDMQKMKSFSSNHVFL